MTRQHNPNMRGFSLIELTVALLIITTLATIAVRSTNDLSFQVRYDQTKDRLEQVKQAIIGNPQRTVNGQPDISGFVADMGRLPHTIRELIENYDCDGPLVDGNSDTDFNNDGGCPLWSIDTVSGLGSGWRGPYLSVSGNPTSSDTFTDGWGRLAQGYCSDYSFTTNATCTATWTTANADNNYGWWYGINNSEVSVFSYGKDHAFGGSDYDADYPLITTLPIIRRNNWLVDISSGISVTLGKQFNGSSSCAFSATGSYTNQATCENAGGGWSGSSCTFGQDNCKTVGGQWNACRLGSSACSLAGGSYQARCQFTQRSCNAASGSGAWDISVRQCQIESDQTRCLTAGGAWNGSPCDFNENTCSLAGGAWVNQCIFNSSTCPTATTGVTWETSPVPNSCNFTQAACTSLNGVSNGDNYCYMTHGEYAGGKYNLASCNSSGGSWTGRICLNIFYRNPNTSAITYASSDPVNIDALNINQTVRFLVLDVNDIDGDSNFSEPMPFIPAGRNAIGVYEHDGDCDPNTNIVYPANHQITQVDFFAHSNSPIINW